MKSLMLLSLSQIEDLHSGLGTSSARDKMTVETRFSHEGESFLTVTLPQLDDHLLSGLSSGSLPHMRGWRLKRGSVLPAFLYQFWKRIFSDDGTLLSDPDSYSIRSIRQVSRSFKKIFEVCSDDLVDKEIANFLEVEKGLCKKPLPPIVYELRDVSRLLFGDAIRSAVQDHGDFRHGPGAVAESFDSVEKWTFPSISPAIAEEFGFELFRGTWFRLDQEPPAIEDIPARLIAVPKTALKPRLISIEPSYNQFVQQGIRLALERFIDRDPICSYRSALPNQELARRGSIDGSLATIDLSEASDRVRLDLVLEIFGWNENFTRMLRNTRSRYVETPDGSILCLKKFAPMGSSLTFPIESMVFACIAVLSVLHSRGERVTRESIRKVRLSGEVRVYGDDIIIPSPCVPTAYRYLEDCSLKVNRSKSFSDGYFRESCGSDWYAGKPVKPTYVRSRLPRSRRDVKELIALSAFRELYRVSFPVFNKNTLKFIDDLIVSILGFYPYHSEPESCPGITRQGDIRSNRLRWDKKLQRTVTDMYVPSYRRKATKADPNIQVEAFLRSRGDKPSEDKKAYTHHGRPFSARLTRRREWVF